MTNTYLTWGLTPQALTNTAPFTYRDNATFLEKLSDVYDKVAELVDTVNNNASIDTTNIVDVNDKYTKLVADWNAILPNLDPAHVQTLVTDLQATVNAATVAANSAASTATTATENANSATAAATAATNSLTQFQASIGSQLTDLSNRIDAEAATARTNEANADLLTTGTVADARLPLTAQKATLDATYLPRDLSTLQGVSVKDEGGDNVTQFAPLNLTGKRWDVRVGTAAAPTAGNGPAVKISQTENVTDVATQMGGIAGANEYNAALSVAAKGLPGSLSQTNAVMITADGAPTGTDVCALGVSGRVTGGAGTGFGAYLQGRRDIAGGRSIGAEIRTQNEAGVDGNFATSGGDTVGIWITSGGTGGKDNAAGVEVASADTGSQFVVGFHATAGSCRDYAFRDDSAAGVSFQSVGNHATGLDLQGVYSGYAIQLGQGTDSSKGISFGNDAILYRIAASKLRLSGALVVSQGITNEEQWTAPVLQNSWVYFGGGEQTPQYRKLPDGRVTLRGLVKSGTTGVPIFTLPLGYRPSAAIREIFMQIAGAGIAEIDVKSNGDVVVAQYIAGGSNSVVSLSGVTFCTD